MTRSKAKSQKIILRDAAIKNALDLQAQARRKAEHQAHVDAERKDRFHNYLSAHHLPNFVGMYFIAIKNETFLTGRVLAQISEGYFLIQYDHPNFPLTVRSAADFNKRSNGCFLDWQFFADIESRKKWMDSDKNGWLGTRLRKNAAA